MYGSRAKSDMSLLRIEKGSMFDSRYGTTIHRASIFNLWFIFFDTTHQILGHFAHNDLIGKPFGSKVSLILPIDHSS